MLMDIIRAVVERVMRDKILMAIVIIGILGIFFTGTSKGPSGRFVSNEAREGQEQEEEEAAPGQNQNRGAKQQAPNIASLPGTGQPQGQQGLAQQPGQVSGQQPGQGGQAPGQVQGQAQGQAPNQAHPNGLTPPLACQFVQWWLGPAMDYSPVNGKTRHEEAMKWMLPAAAEAFKAQFWTDVVSQGVSQGAMTGAYQPSDVTALALNPDGTVAVKAVGALVTQQAGFPPQSQSLTLHFLVGKNPDGVRVLNFYAEPGQIQSQAMAQPQEVGQAQMVGPPQESQAPLQPGERRQAWPRDY